MEHLSLEQALNNKKKDIEEKIAITKVKRQKLIKEINNYVKDKEDLDVDIDLFENMRKKADKEEQMKVRSINKEIRRTKKHMDEESLAIMRKIKVRVFFMLASFRKKRIRVKPKGS
jgi:hypothetical protein